MQFCHYVLSEHVSVCIQDGKTPEDVKEDLMKKNINVSISAIGSTRLDFSDRGLDKVLRASVHYYNTEEEVERFLQVLKDL